MNRKQRRKLEKMGLKEKADPNTTFTLKFDINTPGGLLRSPYPSRFAGSLDAKDEVDLFRGIFVRLAQAFGYDKYDKALIGMVTSLVNAMPKRVRGAIAYGIIEGQGLIVDTDEVELCKSCGAEQQRTLAPPEEQPEPTDEDDDPDPVMVDSTPHTMKCEYRTGEEGAIVNPEFEATEAVVILTPPMYEPMNMDNKEDEAVLEHGPECLLDTEGNVIECHCASNESETPPEED